MMVTVLRSGVEVKKIRNNNVVASWNAHDTFPQNEMHTRIELNRERNERNCASKMAAQRDEHFFFLARLQRNWAKERKKKLRMIRHQPMNAHDRNACEKNPQISTFPHVATHTTIIIHIRHSLACKHTANVGAYWYSGNGRQSNQSYVLALAKRNTDQICIAFRI